MFRVDASVRLNPASPPLPALLLGTGGSTVADKQTVVHIRAGLRSAAGKPKNTRQYPLQLECPGQWRQQGREIA